jgi:hypothetical protein
MASNFPTSLDNFTNPTSTDTLDSPPHDVQHSDANDAIESLQAKVGIDSSAVTTSHDYKIGALEDRLDNPTELTLKAPLELWTVSATAATGTVNVDLLSSGAHYFTANASANWTYNFRGDGSNSLDSLMSTNESVTVVHAVTNGGTARYPTAFQVDGSAVTPEWSGGSAPSGGNANSIDTYLFTIIKLASATFTVLAQQVQFA